MSSNILGGINSLNSVLFKNNNKLPEDKKAGTTNVFNTYLKLADGLNKTVNIDDYAATLAQELDLDQTSEFYGEYLGILEEYSMTDGNRDVISVTDLNKLSETFDIDEKGQIKEKSGVYYNSDGTFNTEYDFKYEYDRYGQKTGAQLTKTMADGVHNFNVMYDSTGNEVGRIETLTDDEGNVTKNYYDSIGRKLSYYDCSTGENSFIRTFSDGSREEIENSGMFKSSQYYSKDGKFSRTERVADYGSQTATYITDYKITDEGKIPTKGYQIQADDTGRKFLSIDKYYKDGNLIEEHRKDFDKNGNVKTESRSLYNENNTRKELLYTHGQYNPLTGKNDITTVVKRGFSGDEDKMYYLTGYDEKGEEILKSKEDVYAPFLEAAVEKGIIKEDEISKIHDLLNQKNYLCSTDFTGKRYDELNEILFGPKQDKTLEKDVNEAIKTVYEKYGKNIDIKYDNNLITESYANENGILSDKTVPDDFAQSVILEALDNMNAHGEEFPETIYFTELMRRVAGVFCPTTNTAITINTSNSDNPKDLKETIYHETAHLLDYNAVDNGTYQTSSDPDIKIPDNNAKLGKFEGKITANDIGNYISSYALENNTEFIAETTVLIIKGIIVQGNDGKYTINPEKLTDGSYENAKGFGIKWNNEKEQVEKLNYIMDLYNHLTPDKTIAKPQKI